MMSKQSIFSILNGQDDQQQKEMLIEAHDEQSLQERALDIKTKIFRSTNVPTSDEEENHTTASNELSAKDLWVKYVEPIDVSYVDSITTAGGVQFTVESSGALLYLMNEKPFPKQLWKKMFIKMVNTDCIGTQTKESILLACGQCELASSSDARMLVVTGKRNVGTLFTHAVHSKNMDALNILVDYLVECENAGLTPAVDPHAPTASYKIATSSLTAEQLRNIGGPTFHGVHKEYFVHPPNESNNSSCGGASTKLGRQSSFLGTSATNAQEVDLTLVPKFQDVNCVWTADEGTIVTALEMAYSNESQAAFDALMRSATVRNLAGKLKLSTHRAGMPIPESIALMQHLTKLTICTPRLSGPVPKQVFELLSLQELVLVQCRFSTIPDDIVKLVNLETLDISGMPNLTDLPLLSLGKMEKLTSVNCASLPGVKAIPREIIEQGPLATAGYLHSLGEGAETNHDVLLMLIGDGEAGKTSMLQALKNTETNCAREIGVDERTIGIDISSFQPFTSEPLRFFAWDFGGQGIYAIMQQLFVSRRALYPLLWRVRQSLDVSQLDRSIKCDICKKPLVAASSAQQQQPVYRVKGQGLCHAKCVSYEPLIASWTERLQFRVPGVSMVLIATHVDCATTAEVDEQCDAVARVVERLLARQAQTMPDVPPLRIHNSGQSLRVNNMSGEGVVQLRETLHGIAKGLDFYGEMIPASYVRLKQKLREMQHHGQPSWRTWLHWEKFRELAAECGIVDPTALKLATKFFHDVGELRYFGDQGAKKQEVVNLKHTEEEEEEECEYDSDGDPIVVDRVDDQQEKVKEPDADSESSLLLAETVFPNPFWIVDVLRSLIRHDHSAVLDLVKGDTALSNKERRTLRRRVYRLMQRGTLHESLLHYVWHGVAGLSDSAEVNADEFRRLLALMKAFNILMDKPGEALNTAEEWIVPTLSAGKHSHTIESSAFIDDSLPFVCRLVYDALPPYFDMILIARIMNSRIAESVDFVEGAAAFHQLANRALLFAGLGKVRVPRSVFRQDQLCEERLRTVLKEEQCHVVIAASCRKLMVQLIDEVAKLESFFPGLRRLIALFPCYSCRTKQSQRKQKAAQDADALAALQEGAVRWESAEAEDLVQQQALTDAYPGLADAINCAAFYFNNQPAIDAALQDLTDTEFASLLLLKEDGNLAVKFKDDCRLKEVYCAGYTVFPARFYQEVLVFMMALKSVLDPTTEDALRFNRDEHHAAIQACQAAVAERQFTTAFQQAGAELPSLRTVQKFCAKHIDALSTAWELCPELEVLCVGLHSALQQEVTAVNGSIIANADVSRLSREEAVPEYMHLLRSVVEEVAAYLRPQSSQRERADISEAYRRTLSERQADLASLYRLHPELSLAAVSSEAPYASCSSPEQKSFLVQAYGAGTALLQEKHHALLTASLTVFDAQCEKNPFPREQGSMTVEQDLATRFTASPSSVQLAAFVDRFFEGAYDVCIAAAKDLSKNTAKPPECTNQHLAELLLPEETVVGFLRTQYAAHTDKIMLQVSEIDPSISAAAAAECIENAYIQYLERNLQYLPVLDGLLKAGEGELWIKCFGQKDETSNFPTELVSCATQLQKAQTMLLIARYVQDVKQYLQSDEQALADFAEALPARPYPDKSAKEFADLWELHSALHGYLWGNNSSLSQVKGVEPVSEASENCRFYAKVEYFLFEAAKQPPFDDAFVACNMLKSIYSILEAGNRECYTQYLALQTSMHAWSAQFPITCGADKTDFTERYEATVDDEVTHKLALRVAFANRSLSILMLEGFKRMVKAEDVTIQQEILRAVSYLSDPRHDPSSLLSLVKKRIEDMGLRSTLISGMLKSPETQESLKKVNDKWKSRSDLVAKLKMFYAKVKSNDIWSEEHLHIQTFFEGVEGGLKDIILNAKKGLLDTFKKCVWRDQTWQAVGADLENILSQARAEAAAWKNRHSESIEGLRAGSLPSALREITLLAKGGIKVHTSLLDATSGARKARVLQAAEATSSRLDKYMQLMQLRAVHAPPWHFGYGQRVANSKLSANNSVSPQQLKPEAWKSDWQEFTRKDYSGVCFMCPAEHEVEKSVVQVADSSEVLISCTDAGLPWAEIILKCLTEMDERMQISLLPSKPAHKVGVGSWVYFQSELYMDSGDSPQVGLLVEYTSHFFKGVCLHFDKTFSTMRPVDFDSCQVMPDYVRWLGKIKALELMHAPVSVNCDGKLRRGLTVYRRPTGRDAMISVHLDGDEAPSLYPLEYVEPLIPLARHHKKAWQQGFQFMVGMRVKVGTKAAMRDGSVCDEQVEVRFDDDGTIGVFPIHLVEPIDAERKAALATGKAVICCIDSSFNSELLCVDEVADAENLGLGIIPVLLPGYKIYNYQEWWPQELSALKCHSLFIDMRSVGLDTAGTSTIRDICTENISPTLRVVLSEQKDRNAVTALATSPVAPPADPATTSRTADNGVGSQYVYCELCTVEKVYLDSTSGTSADRCNSKPATGSFDRWRCQQLVAEWTAQELQRREQHPDQPSVMMCPVSVHCSGAETHEKLARDVLAIKEKRTSYPCPSCMTKGILPPYCFDRELCLAELEYNSGGGGFVTCKRCHQPTALHELLVCEVFLSYCWGSPQCPKCTAGLSVFEQRELKRNGLCEPCGGTYPGNSWKYSTQRLVSELKGAIEPEAGVMCWQDVDRLVGGKDLEREMEMGVKQADVIVIFLDDGYVKSFNCRREYLHATKHGKYIIPILLSGYTGGSGNVDPERWWPESMSSLAQFQPIYLTEGSQMENVLFEVCERIQSRFHRAQRFPTADDAIAYLRDYSSWGVTRKAFLADNMSLDRREEVEAHLQDAFVKMDRDGNNLVDEAELTAFLDENNICLSREQISTLIMEADVDHNGCLSLEELKQAVFAILEEQAREGTVA